MNNTRKITISIDIEQVLKTVYAESACLALMSGRDSRPAVISSDNRRLLGVYCLNAWLCLAGELASIVDSQSFSIPSDSDTTYTLSLTVDGVGTARACAAMQSATSHSRCLPAAMPPARVLPCNSATTPPGRYPVCALPPRSPTGSIVGCKALTDCLVIKFSQNDRYAVAVKLR